MIAEIAVATNTAPRQWINESDEMLATVIDIFRIRAEMIAEQRRRIR